MSSSVGSIPGALVQGYAFFTEVVPRRISRISEVFFSARVYLLAFLSLCGAARLYEKWKSSRLSLGGNLPPLPENATWNQRYERIWQKYGRVSFLSLDHIPEELHADEYLSLPCMTCAISHAPPRHPVSDPTSPEVLYDASAINRWLQISSRSPITRQPVLPGEPDVFQSARKVVAEYIVERCLEIHQKGFDQWIALKETRGV